MFTGDYTSLLKNKSSIVNSVVHSLVLAVYPYELDFAKPLEHPLHLYFQKNLQVIGDLPTPIAPAPKNTTRTLLLPRPIFFRVYSFQRLNYQWSLYHVNEQEEEQFQESAAVDLKAQFTGLTPSMKSSGRGGPESYVLPSSIERTLRIKFPKTGLTVSYLFYAAEDTRTIQDIIRQRLASRESDTKELQIQDKLPSFPVKKKSSSEGNINPESKMSILEPRNLANQRNTNQVTPLSEAVDLQELLDDGKPKENTTKENKEAPSNDLDALIFSEDKNKEQEFTYKVLQTNQNNPHQNIEPTDDDLNFGIEKSTRNQPENNTQHLLEKPALPHNRDYSILKLDSDQGRLRMDQIDKKLQLQEMQVIEEEPVSRMNINSAIATNKNRQSYKNSNNASQNRHSRSNQSNLVVNSPTTVFNIDIKKIAIFFLVIIGAAMLIAAAPKGAKNSKKSTKSRLK